MQVVKKCEYGRKHTYLCRRESTIRMTYRERRKFVGGLGVCK